MRRFLILLVVGPLLVPTAASAASAASADPAGPAALDYTAPPSSDMVQEQPDNPNSDVQAQAFSPSGCYGQSNWPHVSTKAPTEGDVKGLALSHCQFNVDTLHVKATVWQKRWWGWQQMGEPGTGTLSFVNHVQRSGHYDGCINNDWRTVGNHYSIELGDKYSAETMNWHDDLQC